MRVFVLCLLVLLGVPSVGNANQYYGDGVTNSYLGSGGWCYFDWYRPPELAKQRSTLEVGGQIKLQTRFMWMGTGTVPYVENKTGEHAILGLTQGTIVGPLGCSQKGYSENLVNSPSQPGEQQWIHRYGVGVLVSPKGLNLELWNGDGTSYLWSQTNNRCAILVPSGTQAGMCLSATPNPSGYITSNAGFSIQKGSYYWLRQTLTGNPDGKTGWVRLYAELLQQTANSTILLQQGQLA